MTEKLTAEQVIQDLREIRDEYGADRTAGCVYTEYTKVSEDATAPENFKPVCIAGAWVAKRAPHLLPQLDAGTWSDVVGLPSMYDGQRYEDDKPWNPDIAALADEEAHRLIREAQMLQDDGHCWGDAVEAAEELYRELKGDGVTIGEGEVA